MEYIITSILILNSFLLIGIAGSIAKLLKYFQGIESSKEEWDEIVKERRVFDPQTRMPNYTEINPPAKEQSQNWDGIPVTTRNWDGIPTK